MTLEYQLIFLFSGLGALNGLSLCAYLLLLKSEKRLTDYFLGGLLLMLSVRILKSIFLFFNPHFFQLFVQVGLYACSLIGPFLYLYVVSMTEEEHDLRHKWWWYIVPSSVIAVCLSYWYPHTGPENSWGIFVPYIYGFWLMCLFISAYQMRGVFKKMVQDFRSLSHEEIWLLNVFGGVTVIYLAYQTSSYTSYIVGALSFSFVFYLSILLRIYQRKQQSIASDRPLKYAKSSLRPAAAKSNMERLEKLMRDKKSYLDPNLTLTKLSEQIGINSKDLSQSINQMTDDNYSNYIASLRVKEAKLLLVSSAYQNHKIAAIAYESGFNSLSSFNATFKKVTGETPNAYQKARKTE